MVSVKYYIENVEFGTVLLEDGDWDQFSDQANAEDFPSFEDATQHIQDVLPEGVYRIFSRITKVL